MSRGVRVEGEPIDISQVLNPLRATTGTLIIANFLWTSSDIFAHFHIYVCIHVCVLCFFLNSTQVAQLYTLLTL